MTTKGKIVRGGVALLAIGYVTLWTELVRARQPFAVPVEGIAATAVPPSFHAPRDGGRLHQGVDILARRGTRVHSIAWGVVVGIETQPHGGKVVWVLGRGAMLIFYAHLEEWAKGLHVGQIVEEGTILGKVGDTGNARGIPHLHFETRPAATVFAPIDPLLIIGERRSTARDRVAAALGSLGEKR